MTLTNSLLPPVLYAQDKKSVFLTVNLQDVTEPAIKPTENSIAFSCNKNGTEYAFNIDLFDNVNQEVCNAN